jgi:NADP-dependent 3-hydroxy acid dehydrogenase YdfG
VKTQNINEQCSTRGIAVVEGASSGLGTVYADRLANRGHDLLLVARSKDRLHNLAQDPQKQYGIQANILVADLGLATDLKRVIIPHSALGNLDAIFDFKKMTSRDGCGLLIDSPIPASSKI